MDQEFQTGLGSDPRWENIYEQKWIMLIWLEQGSVTVSVTGF